MVHSAEDGSIPVVDMSALIALLEAAEAGSRELDAAVWAASNGYELFEHDGAGWRYRMKPDDIMRHERTGYISPYTTSLDAALALAERVLPGRWIRSFDEWPARTVQEALAGIPHWPDNSWRVTVTQDGGGHGQFSGVSLTPALALCIAILKAKAQGEGR